MEVEFAGKDNNLRIAGYFERSRAFSGGTRSLQGKLAEREMKIKT